MNNLKFALLAFFPLKAIWPGENGLICDARGNKGRNQSGNILVSRSCKSLAEISDEIERLKRNLDEVKVAAWKHFEG